MELQSLMMHTQSLEEQLEKRDQEFTDLQTDLHEVHVCTSKGVQKGSFLFCVLIIEQPLNGGLEIAKASQSQLWNYFSCKELLELLSLSACLSVYLSTRGRLGRRRRP